MSKLSRALSDPNKSGYKIQYREGRSQRPLWIDVPGELALLQFATAESQFLTESSSYEGA